MKTRTIRLDADQPDDRLLQPAADALRRGELVAFPTETVYGLGANALDENAVGRIFDAKGRPADNPLIVHIASMADLPPLVREISPLARKLFAAFAPGPLTLILPKSPAVPDLVTAGLDTVAVRIPAHPVARRLIELAGVPVAAPSANRSGRPSPTRGWHVAADLAGRIAYLIESGSSPIGLESTVVDATGLVPVILRPGAITAAAIRSVAGDVAGPAEEPATPRSPGMKYRHYAPRASVVIADQENPADRFRQIGRLIAGLLDKKEKVGLFTCREALSEIKTPVVELNLGSLADGWQDKGRPDCAGSATCVTAVFYGESPDAAAAGVLLFDALRGLDRLGMTVIVAEGLPDEDVGEAYMNRLRKAAETETRREKKVLFVCTGNTCRSPMAASLFNQLNEGTDWQAESAGLSAMGGEPASPAAVRTLYLDFGLDLTKHQARPVTGELIDAASLVLTMTAGQRDSLRQRYPSSRDKIRTIGEMAGEPRTQVDDPFGGDLERYRSTAASLAALLRKLIDHLTD